MSASGDQEQTLGLVARVAQRAARHPRRVIIGWILLLIAALAISSALVPKYANNFSLPGTESQRALDLLQRDFPAQAGDSDQIVFGAHEGTVNDPAVRARIEPMLAKVETLPHVTGVVSPYSTKGAHQISPDGKVAFATVTFDERANVLPPAATDRVISAAKDVAHAGAGRGARRQRDRTGPEAILRGGDGDRAAAAVIVPADHLRVVRRDGAADPHGPARAGHRHRRWRASPRT